jgi:hypothetical protein
VAPKSSQQPGPQQQQQQQQTLVVTAVQRTGAAAGQRRQLELPAQVVSALTELQLSEAVGWLRLVRLPPAPAAAGTPAGRNSTAQPTDGTTCLLSFWDSCSAS